MNSWTSFQQRVKKLEFDLKRENRDARLDESTSNRRGSITDNNTNATSSSSSPGGHGTPSRSSRPGFFSGAAGRFSLGKGSVQRGLSNFSFSRNSNHSPSHLNNNSSNTGASSPTPPSNLFLHHSTVNAQCLSPRPRPKALPIGPNSSPARGREASPSPRGRPQQGLFFGQPGHNAIGSISSRQPNNNRLNEMSFQNNNVITFDGIAYQCTEDDFEYLAELGSGSCGQVSKRRHKPTGNILAVKQMRRSGNDDESKRIAMDLGVILKCSACEHIVQCYGYLIKDTEVLICMELMETCFEKLLKKIGGPIPEHILGKIAVSTVKALHFIKENHDVIHRDVKPSNILINERGAVKLCDFGISGHLVDSKAKTRAAGCAAYLAPERIEPPPDSLYDVRADVWSLGITLVELALGEFPYSGCKTDFEVLSRVMQDPSPSLPTDGRFSSEFCNFISACLTKDYSKRPKYKKLLEHPFIRHYDLVEVDVGTWFASVNSSASPSVAVLA